MRPKIIVLYGGISDEREVSLRSGEAVARGLEEAGFQVERHDLQEDRIPASWNPRDALIFPILHGTFGEDGQLQEQLERGGFEFVGSDSIASRVCFDKELALLTAERIGVPTANRLVAQREEIHVEEALQKVGFPAILKPACQGSSVDLYPLENADELQQALSTIRPGKLILEEKIQGPEFSVGVVDGRGLGIVEIRPKGGLYDYQHKYTAGATEYLFPAPISEGLTRELQRYAAEIFEACGCRDFARVDFMQRRGGSPVFLEINTLPGMTATSLLPKSASVCGWSFSELVTRMAEPALKRFEDRMD